VRVRWLRTVDRRSRGCHARAAPEDGVRPPEPADQVSPEGDDQHARPLPPTVLSQGTVSHQCGITGQRGHRARLDMHAIRIFSPSLYKAAKFAIRII
jgi:hypothetical protein